MSNLALFPNFDIKIILVIILITVQAFLDIATVMFVGYSLSVYINGVEALEQIKILMFLNNYSLDLLDFESVLKASIFLILVRSIFTTAANYLSLTVAANIGKSLRQTIISHYVECDYATVRNTHSNVLQRNIVDLVNLYVGKIVQPTIKILSDGLIVIGLLVVVFLSSNIRVLLSLFLLMGLIILIDYIFKNVQSKNGSLNVQAISLLHALVKDITNFSAEIRLSNYPEYIQQRNQHASGLFASSWRNSVFWVTVSRLILETLAYLFLIYLIWHVSTINVEKVAIIGMLVTFARAIPIFNSIATNLAMLRNGAPLIHELANMHAVNLNYVREDNDVLAQRLPSVAMSARDLIYGIDTQFNDKPINFDLKPGEILGVTGPSGSGKSTLVEVLAGLRHPSRGVIVRSPNCKLTLLTQTSNILFDTLKRNIDPHDNVTDDKIHNVLARLDLRAITNRFPLDSTRKVTLTELSGGQVQRLNIARSLLQDKAIWILDEPTSALDGKSKRLVMSLIKDEADKGIAVIIITHDLELIQLCHKQLELGG